MAAAENMQYKLVSGTFRIMQTGGFVRKGLKDWETDA